MGGTAMRVTGLAVAVVVVLSACTGGEHNPGTAGPATSGPSRSSAVSASPSPSVSLPTRPERPAAMQREDANGAAAAAEYFIELYPYVMATGDTKEFEAMSHPECDYCNGALENVAWLRETRRNFEGGLTEAALTRAYEKDDLTGIFPLDFRTSQGEIWIRDQSGKQVDHVTETDFDARVEVDRNGPEWVIVEIAPDPGSDQ